MKAFLSSLCTADPLPSEKIGEGAPSLIFSEGRGQLYTGYFYHH